SKICQNRSRKFWLYTPRKIRRRVFDRNATRTPNTPAFFAVYDHGTNTVCPVVARFLAVVAQFSATSADCGAMFKLSDLLIRGMPFGTPGLYFFTAYGGVRAGKRTCRRATSGRKRKRVPPVGSRLTGRFSNLPLAAAIAA